MKRLLTKNKTLGLMTFNIPAQLTCPGKSQWCAKYCYARKGNFLYSNVVQGQHNRWEATQDLDTFISTMVAEIQKDKVKIIRVHSSGDFYSVDYFRAWLDIAAQCPDTQFFAYSRTWRVPCFAEVLGESENVANFTLWHSTDPSTGCPDNAPRIAYILPRNGERYSEAMPKPNCEKQIDHTKNCATCGLCFSKTQSAVTFNQH